MTAIPATNLVNIEDLTSATMTVAMFKHEPQDFSTNNSLVFRAGFDDLDYLDFTILNLPSGHEVALIRHKGSPQPGTELCVPSNQDNVASVIREACKFLNINESELQWVHPNVEQQIAIAS